MRNKYVLTVGVILATAQLLCAQVNTYTEAHTGDQGYSSISFKLDQDLSAYMANAPLNGEVSKANQTSIILPLPDGGDIELDLQYAPIIAEDLADKYPEIRSYKASAPGYSGRVGFTYKGFNGMIFTPNGTVFYDVVDLASGTYRCYFRKDYKEHFRDGKQSFCGNQELDEAIVVGSFNNISRGGARSGEQLRTYRLALACTGEYAQYHGGTVIGALSAMVVTMNRVNGVYERDVAITMEIIGNNDGIIYLDGNTDPYSNGQEATMLGENQTNINSTIGANNYDIGHVFGTGGGGIASLGSVCSFQSKARGVTSSSAPTGDPFDIDYVAHEMGHQFGANHTQNNSCNRTSSSAYEPGSASTIMGYAGICAPNLQNNSDDYFHAHSLDQIVDFSTNGSGAGCAATTNSGNSAPVVTVPTGGFFIPIETPFLLEGSATDADGDDMTYCWEEMDLGSSSHPDSPIGDAPIFRSWQPKEVSYRVCPQMVNIIIGNTVIGETYPTYDRDLTFRLTARDENNAAGGFGYEEVEFEVSEDAGPFIVTSPTTGESVEAVNGYAVTWDVAGTDVAPVNCQTVTIDLCKYDNTTQVLSVIETLAESTANDGIETVSISESNVGNGYYIRVKAADNIFFNINGGKFNVIEPEPLETADITLLLTPNFSPQQIELSWNDDFSNESAWYIERSVSNNQSFILIDSLQSNSTTYSDSLVDMFNGAYYYRVYAKNSVSTSAYSNEVEYDLLGIQNADAGNISIYPNPNTGSFEINSTNVTLESIQVIDGIGRVLMETTGNASNNQSITIENGKGIYLLRITTSSGELMHKQVLVY